MRRPRPTALPDQQRQWRIFDHHGDAARSGLCRLSSRWRVVEESCDRQLEAVRDLEDSENASVASAVLQRSCQERFSRICTALGIAEPKTMEDVYPFLLALGVIEEYRRGAVAWVRSLATDLDPIDVLRLDAQEAGEERACRGEMRFHPVAHVLAKLFRVTGGRNARVATSLLRLAGRAGVPVERLRPCLTGGVDAGILICDQDLGTLQEHRIFELKVSAAGEAAQYFTNQYRLVA